MKYFYLLLNNFRIKNNIFELIFYPLTSIGFNSYSLVQSTSNIIKSLFSKNAIRMFSIDKAINNYWYDTLAFNLLKHGRFGYSKTTIDRDYLVGNWFHISKLSIICS